MESVYDIIHILAKGIDLLGKIIIAYTAIRVHDKVRKDHKLDEGVYKAIRSEERLAFVGIGMMILAYAVEIALVLVK